MWRRVAARPVVVALVVLVAVAVAGPAAAKSASPSHPLTGRRIAEQSKPAVQLIETDFSADLTVYDPKPDQAALDAFVSQDAGAAQLALAGDEAGLETLLLEQIVAHPDRYIQKGDPTTGRAEIVAQGSGFVVTPDGYVVTNTHVVAPPDDEIKQQMIKTGLPDLAKSSAESIAADLKGAIPDNLVQQVIDVTTRFLVATAEVGTIDTHVYVGGGPSLNRKLKGRSNAQEAEVIAHGEEYPGKDVAVVKISGHDLPSLPLGDDTRSFQGDQLYAIGYPGDATFLSGASPDAQVSPTLTSGKVSNKLPSEKGGFTLIETDAVINEGSSGGPALNEDGEVIGITTAGTTSQGGGQFGFIIPTTVVNEYIHQANVRPSQSREQLDYVKALDLIDQSHYKAARKELAKVDAEAPNNPYTVAKLQEVNQAIAAGRDKPLSSFPRAAVAGAAAGALLIVLVLLMLVLMRGRRKKRAATAGPAYAGAYAPPAGSYGAPPPGPSAGSTWGHPGGAPSAPPAPGGWAGQAPAPQPGWSTQPGPPGPPVPPGSAGPSSRPPWTEPTTTWSPGPPSPAPPAPTPPGSAGHPAPSPAPPGWGAPPPPPAPPSGWAQNADERREGTGATSGADEEGPLTPPPPPGWPAPPP